jgi:hypothetical protein
MLLSLASGQEDDVLAPEKQKIVSLLGDKVCETSVLDGSFALGRSYD